MTRGLHSSVFYVAAMSLAVVSPSAMAQSSAVDPRMTRVDPGRQDTGPLATSSRVLPMDLRMPTDFEQVYQLQARTGERSRAELFARRSGGITAVFPRSQYMQAGGGILAEVPAGTTYYLGKLPETITGSSMSSGERRRHSTYIDNAVPATRLDTSARVDERSLPVTADVSVAARSAAMGAGPVSAINRMDGPIPRELLTLEGGRAVEPMPARPSRAPDRPSVFSDEGYRTKTIHKLLDQAKVQQREGVEARDPKSEKEIDDARLEQRDAAESVK
jgi:hypothetical protein